MKNLNVRTSIKQTVWAFTALAAVASLGACNSQKFSVPPEKKEYGQTVTYSTEVDVLWVIDTSSSMTRHQNLLADQVGLFVDALNQTQLDYQIAVTTMDMSSRGERGRFLSEGTNPAILKATTPGINSILSSRLRAGDRGSSLERGTEAMKAALSEPSLVSGTNKGFLRPNALLAVIFLTDEDDKSTVSDYASWLDSIRPPLPYGDRSWVAHFMGVLPNDKNCTTADWGYSSPGHRYIELAKASGGLAETICDADLRRALTNVKKRVLEVLTEFPLGRKPLIETIKVYVNGQLVPQSEVDGWSYNAAKYTIRFHGNAIPMPGASIKVDYDPAELK